MVAHACIRFAASQSSLVASRIGIPRSVVLAICVGIELRAVARVGDDPLRRRWRCKSGKRHDSRTYQCKLHKALLYLMIGKTRRRSLRSADYKIVTSRTVFFDGSETLARLRRARGFTL
jgi:hypothetical protein